MPASSGGAPERELEAVALRRHAVDLLDRRLSVRRGVEIAAADEQQPVEAGEQLLGVARRRARPA